MEEGEDVGMVGSMGCLKVLGVGVFGKVVGEVGG